ncbi:MAG: transporter permease, partial [Labilithrix sp.]|nr:transporter permease [Labilithrix sp.]
MLRRELRRELAIAFRARVTWVGAALGALLVGHGFVLALDLYSAASRSALNNALMLRELDPLAGIVRPTLGGAQLATAVLGPILASRLLAVEKERRTFGALALASGSTDAIVASKLLVASVLLLACLVCPLALFALIGVAGGHLDPIEVGVALGGHALHAVFVATLAVTAAAWTRTSAQAAALALVASLTTWMIDAGEGFAALAWLGPLEMFSVSRELAPFEHGIVGVGPIGWFVSASASFAAAAFLGARFDVRPRQRAIGALAIVAAFIFATSAFAQVRRAYDWSEQRRQSLPPAAVDALRRLHGPIAIEIWMDREDSRRRQIEADVVAKLRLARSDIDVLAPLDAAGANVAAPQRESTYGRVVVRVGDGTRETRSTSRREIVTLLFEAAGEPLPDWTQMPYPGYPFVVEGSLRSFVNACAYVLVP